MYVPALRELFWAAVGISGYQSAGAAVMLIVLVAVIAIWWPVRSWLEKQFRKQLRRTKSAKLASNIAASILTAAALSAPLILNQFGLSVLEDKTATPQLVIRKFELYPLIEGEPVRVNVVYNNVGTKQVTVKAYDVTAIWDTPMSEHQKQWIEDQLHNSLNRAIREVKAPSRDIPPSPSSYYLTLDGPLLSSEQKQRLQSGRMTFYFSGALAYGDGTTFYCNYTQGDGVIKLCRRQNS